jgi:hypothetical protein
MAGQISSDSAERSSSPMESMLQPFGGLASFIRAATREGNGETFASSGSMMSLPNPEQVAQICGNLQLTG